jgi:hypothetical protein
MGPVPWFLVAIPKSGVDVSYQDRGGSVERARSDHKIKAAEADRRAELMGRDGKQTSSRSLVQRLKARLRPG